MHTSNTRSACNEASPVTTIYWNDTETDAKGWIVFHNHANGVFGGGIFMHERATVEEVAAIAKNMAKKFTVTCPQIGGAKAGIRYDHRRPDAQDVLERFIVANGVILRNMWVTAGDLNTDDAFIEKVIREKVGLSTCQATLGRLFSEATGLPDLSPRLARIIQTSACAYFPLIEGAVGYGVAAAVDFITNATSAEKTSLPRVAIQGFGAVGSSLAYYLKLKGIAEVVAIADQDGYIHSTKGLPIEDLLALRKRKAATHSGHEAERFRKNLFCNLEDEPENPAYSVVKNTHPNDAKGREAYLQEFLRCQTAEVFCPCAVRYQLTPEVVETLVSSTWKDARMRVIVSGANNPYGRWTDEGSLVEDARGRVLELLADSGALVVPDWVANSGTAQLFHRGLSVPFDLDAEGVEQEILEACALPIRAYIATALSRHAGCDVRKLPEACETLARNRIANPVPFSADEGGLSSNLASRYALPPLPTLPSAKDVEALWEMLARHGAECLEREELEAVLARKNYSPVAYDGFEPSGRMHIAQGLMKAAYVNRMTKVGFTYILWVADWFALLNHKMGGDLDKIKVVGRYMLEVWKACGMDTSRVQFLWASEEFDKHGSEYWARVLDISTKMSLKRVTRCTQIMGRGEKDSLSASQIFYPCMQAADIFFLGVDVAQLGMDQRKVNVLAREYAEKVELRKPTVVSHPMVPGLRKGQEKMSKSIPDTAIFMEDSKEEVERKIGIAFCPPGPDYEAEVKRIAEQRKGKPDNSDVERNLIEAMANPVMAYFKSIVVDALNGKPIVVGGRTFANYTELRDAYVADKVGPQELKASLAAYLNEFLQPVRDHFENDPHAKALREKVIAYTKS